MHNKYSYGFHGCCGCNLQRERCLRKFEVGKHKMAGLLMGSIRTFSKIFHIRNLREGKVRCFRAILDSFPMLPSDHHNLHPTRAGSLKIPILCRESCMLKSCEAINHRFEGERRKKNEFNLSLTAIITNNALGKGDLKRH